MPNQPLFGIKRLVVHCATGFADPNSFILFLIIPLDKVTERKRLDGSDDTITSSSLEKISLLRKLGCPLQVNLDSGLLGFHLRCIVGDLSCQNLFLTLGRTDMLNPHMNPLLQDPSIHKFVYSNSNGTLSHIEDNTGPTMVVLMWHTTVYGGIGEDVYVVSYFDVHEVLREVDGAMLAEFLRKHVPGAGTNSK